MALMGKLKGKGAPRGNKNASGPHKGGKRSVLQKITKPTQGEQLQAMKTSRNIRMVGGATALAAYAGVSKVNAMAAERQAQDQALNNMFGGGAYQTQSLDQKNGLASSKTNRY